MVDGRRFGGVYVDCGLWTCNNFSIYFIFALRNNNNSNIFVDVMCTKTKTKKHTESKWTQINVVASLSWWNCGRFSNRWGCFIFSLTVCI